MIKIICPNCEIEFTSKILSGHKEPVVFCCYCGDDVVGSDEDEDEEFSFTEIEDNDDEED